MFSETVFIIGEMVENCPINSYTYVKTGFIRKKILMETSLLIKASMKPLFWNILFAQSQVLALGSARFILLSFCLFKFLFV